MRTIPRRQLLFDKLRKVRQWGVVKEKPRLTRRAELAEDIEKRLKLIIADLEKIPPFKGKARFIDKILQANTRAHNLAWDLRYDAEESNETAARTPARKTQSTAKP